MSNLLEDLDVTVYLQNPYYIIHIKIYSTYQVFKGEQPSCLLSRYTFLYFCILVVVQLK